MPFAGTELSLAGDNVQGQNGDREVPAGFPSADEQW